MSSNSALAAVLGVALLGMACGMLARLQGPRPPTGGVVGRYECEGEISTGASYRLQLDIVVVGDTYQLTWTEGSVAVLHGLGLFMNDHLAVALVAQGRFGVAMYRVTPGRLTGLWTGGGPTVLPEICVTGAAA